MITKTIIAASTFVCLASGALAQQNVQQAQIIDRHGFGRPLVAATLSIPKGWKSEGGIVWSQNMSGCGPSPTHVNWRAIAPDGIGMISVLPEETWSGNNFPVQGQTQCPNVTVTDTKQFILSFVQRHRPNARLLDYHDRPDIVAQVNQQIEQMRQPDMYGSETRQWAGAGLALISYQMNGKEVHELIGTGVIFNLMRMPGVYPGEVQEYLSLSTLPGFAMRMPKGKLDLTQAEFFRSSGKPGREWQQLMAQHNAKIARINAKGAADRARITSETNREISDMQMDSWRRQQASSDRTHREALETIRGTETYNDPSGNGTVQLDYGYDNNYQLDDGSFVQTNDPFYNPYADTGQNATELTITE